MKLLLLLLCLLLAAPPTRAAERDTLSVAEHTALWQPMAQSVSRNPALMAERYATAFSQIGAGYAYSHANEPFLYQTGRGERFASFEATSYLPLSARTTVWGEASYRTGRREAVKWNSTADYLLLYPHVMADTLGGALTSERYTFRAGWAGHLGRFTLGAEADFRAQHEYRTYDPRPRSIVTDLSLRLGAAYPAGRYRLAAAVGGRFYKQTNSVKFFREAGTVPEYQMTGLGTDYRRFATGTASVYYKATGLLLGFDAVPVCGGGPWLSAGYAYTPYRRILPGKNSLPLTTLRVEQLRARAGWKLQAARGANLTLAVGTDYEWRAGDEHIAGNASSSEYRIIADLTLYHAHHADWYGEALGELPSACGTWRVRLRGGLRDFSARYEHSERSMSWREAYTALQGQWQHRLHGQQLLTCGLAVELAANTKGVLSMPFATLDAATTDLLRYTYAHATANRYTAALSARYDLPLNAKVINGLFFEGQGSLANADTWHSGFFSLATGLTF